MIKESQVTITEVPQRSVPAMSTVVNIHRETEVPDHIVWSLFNSIYFNICCLGLVAFTYSVKSRDRKMVGDVTGAQSYASTAKKVNIVALVLGLILTIVLTVLLLAVVVPAINNAITQAGQNHGGY